MNKNSAIPRIPRDIPLLVIFFVVYFISAKLGLKLAFVHASATAVWPPTGIALFAFLVFGYRVWPAIFLGAFAANITNAGNFLTTLGIATGNMLEGLVGAYLINRYANGRYAFEQAQDIFKFAFLGGMIATMVSATVGVASLALGGFAAWTDFPAIWWTWWLGDLSGALIVAPFLVLWIKPLLWPGWKKMFEAAALFFVLLAVGYIVYSGIFPYQYILLPILLLVAFRFNARGASAATFVLSAIALWGTLHGYGPFTIHGETENESLLLLQTFIATVSMTIIPIASLISEHRKIDRAKSEFISLASHQLRTPLSIISWASELLFKKEGTRIRDSSRQSLQDIVDANRRMINLVDALLNISRTELGRLFVDVAEVFPGTVAEHVLDELAPEIKEKNITVTRLFDMDTTMQADENLLYIVLQNLLSNAVKYTPEGGTITVKIAKEPTGTIVSVADTGYGIPDEAKPYLFTKFFRAENVRTKNQQSAGLGLYMTKAIVDQVGGRLWYESRLNQGTVFYVEIPPGGMRTTRKQEDVIRPGSIFPKPGPNIREVSDF